MIQILNVEAGAYTLKVYRRDNPAGAEMIDGVFGTSTPFMLSYQTSDTGKAYSPLMHGTLDVSLISPNSIESAFLDAGYTDVYCELRHISDDYDTFRGFLVLDTISESNKSGQYILTASFSDGIAMLQELTIASTRYWTQYMALGRVSVPILEFCANIFEDCFGLVYQQQGVSLAIEGERFDLDLKCYPSEWVDEDAGTRLSLYDGLASMLQTIGGRLYVLNEGVFISDCLSPDTLPGIAVVAGSGMISADTGYSVALSKVTHSDLIAKANSVPNGALWQGVYFEETYYESYRNDFLGVKWNQIRNRLIRNKSDFAPSISEQPFGIIYGNGWQNVYEGSTPSSYEMSGNRDYDCRMRITSDGNESRITLAGYFMHRGSDGNLWFIDNSASQPGVWRKYEEANIFGQVGRRPEIWFDIEIFLSSKPIRYTFYIDHTIAEKQTGNSTGLLQDLKLKLREGRYIPRTSPPGVSIDLNPAEYYIFAWPSEPGGKAASYYADSTISTIEFAGLTTASDDSTEGTSWNSSENPDLWLDVEFSDRPTYSEEYTMSRQRISCSGSAQNVPIVGVEDKVGEPHEVVAHIVQQLHAKPRRTLTIEAVSDTIALQAVYNGIPYIAQSIQLDTYNRKLTISAIQAYEFDS